MPIFSLINLENVEFMSIYCVSDIHGRFDLFSEGLNKIDFNHQKDKLYILGDICGIGPESLKIYNIVLSNQQSIQLIKGNHDVNLVILLKAFLQVLQYPDLFESLKTYVINYVSGFEKVRYSFSKSKLKKWATTDRRKKCIISLKTYETLCKKYNIAWYWNLINYYESCFKIRKLMLELVNSPNYDYKSLIEYINSCPLIKEIFVDNQKWTLYHSQYADESYDRDSHLEYQFVSRIKSSFNASNTNYVFGHIPIAKINDRLTSRTFNYNKIFKTLDYKNNKYYDIDVSHFGLCFFNLNTLEEIYIGKRTTKSDLEEYFCLDNFKIENITNQYSLTKHFFIKKDDYVYAMAIYRDKILSFEEFASIGTDTLNALEITVPKLPKMKEILTLFIESQKH